MLTENSNEGTDSVQSDISYTLGVNLENLVLTGGNTLNNQITGNIANNSLSGGAGADTLIGGTGDDTYTVDNSADLITENSGEGTDTVQASVSYTLGANIENLVLTGASSLNGVGNNLDNQITGNTGNNILNGSIGSDTLSGGNGNDTYIVDNTGDKITENANQGTDSVQSSLSYTLGANLENLVLTGGNAINGNGNGVNNHITGNTANNVLTGSTGADTLSGGTGDDTYIVDNTGDRLTENANQGSDTVQVGFSYTLGVNFENLILTGGSPLSGNGNSANNQITGNSGSNTLSGGTGADTLIGGNGSDIYIVDNAGDKITENANQGNDTVQSSVSYTLSNNLENLTLTGGNSISGTGNSANNQITGNTAANTLSGGTAADTLIGGAGNDTYIVDNTGDRITENANSGTDTVQASISYTLGSNLENLLLTGSNPINGTGNTANNQITGNTAANTLSGGTGADTLIGGAGNDIYVVDNTGDRITENANSGTDIVQASVSYTLGSNLENLLLTGGNALNGTGNAINNQLTGNNGNNTLNGSGGADTLIGGAGNDTLIGGGGNDTLTGNAGLDRFTFNNKNEGIDLITDFIVVDDTIAVSRTGFGGGLTLGTLQASQFVIGTGATTAAHRFIYNSSTGGLFFDADGTGATAQVQIANLTTGLGLTNNDILVI